MVKPLRDLLGFEAFLILQDLYVYHLPAESIPVKYGVTQAVIDNIFHKVSKAMVYEARLQNYNVSTKNMLFDENALISLVWHEFLHNEIETGKNTHQISIELDLPLEVVNKYI